MVTAERNQKIYELRKKLGWTLREIGDTYGITRQRADQVVRQVEHSVTIGAMETTKKQIRKTEPVSATEAAKISGIPYGTISRWVSRDLVKVVSRPDRARACTNNPVLLDPVSLQERIDLYHPRKTRHGN